MQFELAGTIAVPDGSYLARDAAGAQSVLIVETLGAPSAPSRRRRRPIDMGPGAEPPPLPLVRATTVRAFEPFDSADDASHWLDETAMTEDMLDALIAEGVGLLNRALHACAAASADPRPQETGPEQAVTVRIGYGSGEELSAGRFSVARDLDIRGAGGSRRGREEELRPQELIAAVLGGRERIDACETLLLRTRADLDGGRLREAALQLRVGLEALLVELAGALVDPGHKKDMTVLEERHTEAAEAANAALQGDLDAAQEQSVRELTEICERVLRRRRVLRG